MISVRLTSFRILRRALKIPDSPPIFPSSFELPMPMASLQLTTALLGVGMSAAILFLLRRDHLHPIYGLFWLMVAGVAAALGLWPESMDAIAQLVGIAYSPALALLIAVIVLLIKSLHGDIVNTRIERQIRRLNQRIAIFELEQSGDQAPRQVDSSPSLINAP